MRERAEERKELKEVGSGKYMLIKTFIFDDFGHRHFHYFHFSISNKTPTISQHTGGILPTE